MQIYNANEGTGCWTAKIHMHPGSTLQDHEHIGASEFYVVDGEGFHPQAGAFKTGDYAYEEKGALHTDVSVDDHLYLYMVSYGASHLLNKQGKVQ